MLAGRTQRLLQRRKSAAAIAIDEPSSPFLASMPPPESIRSRLIALALEWERAFGAAPQITTAVSEYDGAFLVGHSDETYADDCLGRAAVSRGSDFSYRGRAYGGLRTGDYGNRREMARTED